MRSPVILDTTLRDGEQRPGIYFTRQEKLELARELDSLGIPVLEVGIPSMGKSERQTLKEMAQAGLKADLLVWNRLSLDDLEICLEDGYKHLHFSVPTSPLQLEKKLRKDEAWLFRQMEEVLKPAVKAGAKVSLGAEDASRTDPEFLCRVFAKAADLGVRQVRYADTLGILTPSEVFSIIGRLAQNQPLPIDFHGHNDFGMATANALAAWEAGAQILSCSLLGLGERAGNSSLEELVGTLRFLKGLFTDLDFPRLIGLCRRLAQMTGEPVAAHKPLVGDEIFTHESGIHVDGLLKDASNYEAFRPEDLGGSRKLQPGKHSGKAALRHFAAEKGLRLEDGEAEHFLTDLRDRLSQQSGLDPEEIFLDFLDAMEAKR